MGRGEEGRDGGGGGREGGGRGKKEEWGRGEGRDGELVIIHPIKLGSVVIPIAHDYRELYNYVG